MTAPTAVQRGRRAAQALMVDTATVTRPGGRGTVDTSTGLLTPQDGAQIYDGPCRVRQPSAQESESLFGEEQVTTSRFVACFPHDATGFAIDDIITLIDTQDPDALGRPLRITAVPSATFTMYKGYPAEAVE